MLQIVETKGGRRKAQLALTRNLRSKMESIGFQKMGFPGGNITLKMHSAGEGRLFFAHFKTDGKGGIERYWNAFGLLNPIRSSQDITVEINVAVESASQQVAAFFAWDAESGRYYLLHSGRVGGGYQGVGQNAFLAWSRNRLIATYDKAGEPARLGILLGPVDDGRLVPRIERFVRQVADFKRTLRDKEINIDELKPLAEEIDQFKSEFSGRKIGQRLSVGIDYITIHGEIVDALQADRAARKIDSEVVANSNYIDLYVKDSGKLVEVYEVKPSAERQSLYTAIGQLIVHGSQLAPAMHLVVPQDQTLPSDIRKALAHQNIKTVRFKQDASGTYKFTED